MVLVGHHEIGEHRVEEPLGDYVFERLDKSEQGLISDAEVHYKSREHDRSDLLFVKVSELHCDKSSQRQ